MKKSYSFTVCALVALFISPCFAIAYSTVPPTPAITSSKGTSVCEGDTTILTATSAGATGYLWSTGATTQSINVSTKGAYTVTASNASGNSAPAQIYINGGMVTPVAIEKQATYGSSYDEDVHSIQHTADGGYIIAGSTNTPHLPSGQHGFHDCFIIKIDSNLHVQWQKYFGGSGYDFAFDISNTSDGGYIIAGNTNSIKINGDSSGLHGIDADYLIIKINSTGIIQWQKCLGGTGYDAATSIKQTPDGGYIVAGSSGSNDGDVTTSYGSGDFWIVKLDTAGIIQWQKSFGGSGQDRPYSIILTAGGYVVSGWTTSNDGDVTGNHGLSDYWIIKLDLAGTILWQKCLGGTSYEYNSSILQTSDGGYITTGSAYSNNGDVTGHHAAVGDFWTVKLSSTGIIQWQKCYGSTGYETANSIIQTSDGGYVLAGDASTNNGDVAGVHGSQDSWIVKLDSVGALQWQKCIGGTLDDNGVSIQQSPDGGFIFAARTKSNDNDVSGNHGGYDIWVVKLGPAGTCSTPSANLNVTNITATKATLNWYATPCAERFNIRYRQTGATAWAQKFAGNNVGYKALTGLLPSTAYEWKVRTRCSLSANSFSEYSPVQYFTTLALREGESIAPNTITACTIFPNPAPGNFSLSFNSDYNSKGDIEIYNTIGELVYKKGIEINEDENTIEVNLTNAPSGVFILNIKSGNRIYRQKLIKE